MFTLKCGLLKDYALLINNPTTTPPRYKVHKWGWLITSSSIDHYTSDFLTRSLGEVLKDYFLTEGSFTTHILRNQSRHISPKEHFIEHKRHCSSTISMPVETHGVPTPIRSFYFCSHLKNSIFNDTYNKAKYAILKGWVLFCLSIVILMDSNLSRYFYIFAVSIRNFYLFVALCLWSYQKNVTSHIFVWYLYAAISWL